MGSGGTRGGGVWGGQEKVGVCTVAGGGGACEGQEEEGPVGDRRGRGLWGQEGEGLHSRGRGVNGQLR